MNLSAGDATTVSQSTQAQSQTDYLGSVPNPLLSIVIPTYNRAEFLDRCLAHHIPLVRDHRIQIQVFDNASTDRTREVTLKWQKEYPLISYVGSEVNQGVDSNFERALKAQDTQYVWLLGDTYHLPEGAIEYIFDRLASTQKFYDMFMFNVDGHVKDVATRDYDDRGELFRDLFLNTTCMSTLVYSAKVIQNARFERFRNSSFLSTGIIYEYIADREFLIHWNREISVKMEFTMNGRSKDLWANERFFEIWIDHRSNLIMSLPVVYSAFDKIHAMKKSSKFGIKEMIHYRSMNIYTLEAYRKYAHVLPMNINCSKFAAAAIVRVPRFMVSAFYRSYLYLKSRGSTR